MHLPKVTGRSLNNGDMTIEKKSIEKEVLGLVVDKGKDPKENFLLAKTFLDQLNEEYPELHFSKSDFIEAFNPERTNRQAVTYAAQAGGKIIGVLMGEEISGAEEEVNDVKKLLRGQSFIINPRFQNTNVARSLMEQVQRDYTDIIMTPVPLGGKEYLAGEDFSEDKRHARQEALRRYYKKLGFEDRDRSSSMYWKKKEI